MRLKFWKRETPPARMRHYLYFPEKAPANKAASSTALAGYDIEVSPSAGGRSWLLLALTDIPDADAGLFEQVESLTALAERCGGDYDGWEVGPIDPGRDESLQGKVAVWVLNEAEKTGAEIVRVETDI
jgi:hypothetical protein